MFNELGKYKTNGHFFYEKNDNLREVCNAPKNGVGIYLIYALKNGKLNWHISVQLEKLLKTEW